MASSFMFEGEDYVLGLIPRTDTTNFPVPTTQYLLLFTSQSVTTVPDQQNLLTGAVGAPYTSTAGPRLMVEETSVGAYARALIATPSTTWPVTIAGANANGRQTQMAAPGVSFAQSNAAFANPINGFGVCNAASSTGQNTGKAFGYANFNDGTSITVNSTGYTIRVQVSWEADG